MNHALPLFILLSLLSLNTYANESFNPSHECTKQALSVSEEDERLMALGQRICTAYRMAGNKIAENVKSRLTSYITKHEKSLDPNNPQDIIRFLNRNKNRILCELGTKSYLMAAFDHGAHRQLYNVLLLGEYRSKTGERIDVNAVSAPMPETETWGTKAPKGGWPPKTVLVYMDEHLADPAHSDSFRREVKRLKYMFVRYFDAKNFKDLPQADEEAFYCSQATR